VFSLGCIDLIGPAAGPVAAGARDEGNRMTAPQSSKCRARHGVTLIAGTPGLKNFGDWKLPGSMRAVRRFGPAV